MSVGHRLCRPAKALNSHRLVDFDIGPYQRASMCKHGAICVYGQQGSGIKKNTLIEISGLPGLDSETGESTNFMRASGWPHRRCLLQPRAQRNFFQEAGQRRRTAFQGRREQHPVRHQAAHLARSQIGHDHDLAAHQLLRLVVLRDAS